MVLTRDLCRYVRTPILTDTVAEYLISKGINFALPEDCAKAMLVFASDRSINGTFPHTLVTSSWEKGRVAYRDPGRALGVVSRQFKADGIMDLGLDDYPQGSTFADWQKTVLDTAGILVVSAVTIDCVTVGHMLTHSRSEHLIIRGALLCRKNRKDMQ